MGGEEELLIRIEFHGLGDDAELHGLQVLRTFRDNHDVGSVLTLDRFPQPSCRQQGVVDDQSVIVNEQDIDAGLHIAVLEGIVKKNDVSAFRLFSACQMINPPGSLPVYSYCDIGEFGLHLIGLVTDVVDCRILAGQYKTVTLAFVAPAQHGHLGAVFQESYEVFHMGRLASPAHGDIAHGDDRHGKGATLQNAHLEEQVPETDSQAVEPTQWQ